MLIKAFIYVLVTVTGASLAYKKRFLSQSGALAACFVGLSVFIGTGWRGFLVLGLFFASSSFFSSYKKDRKKTTEEKLANTSRRNWAQVAANGGAPSGFSLAYAFTSNEVFLYAFFVSIAAAAADTWASELGVLSKAAPVKIINLKRCTPGTSGAVSVFGTAASAAGAIFIASASVLLFNVSLAVFLMICVYGFLGSLADTLLGAFGQVEYKCPGCGVLTERKEHCQQKTIQSSGISWFNNEAVNMFSILIVSYMCIITSWNIT